MLKVGGGRSEADEFVKGMTSIIDSHTGGVFSRRESRSEVRGVGSPSDTRSPSYTAVEHTSRPLASGVEQEGSTDSPYGSSDDPFSVSAVKPEYFYKSPVKPPRGRGSNSSHSGRGGRLSDRHTPQFGGIAATVVIAATVGIILVGRST